MGGVKRLLLGKMMGVISKGSDAAEVSTMEGKGLALSGACGCP